LPITTDIYALAASGGNLYAGDNLGSGVYLSTDNGASWNAVGLKGRLIESLAISGSNVFAGTDNSAYYSTDNGASWNATGLPNIYVNAFVISGTNIFAGTYGSGVYLSTDNGASWNAVNSGLMNTYITTLAVSGTNIFAGTYPGGVWKRPLSDMITSVETPSGDIPKNFILNQNYPNPFNPSTTIKYSLPSESKVIIKIYNLLGQEIKTLVNAMETAGNHQITFTAGKLSSGVYLYRIQAGDFIQTKKMVLLK
jgi:hypothetical protein